MTPSIPPPDNDEGQPAATLIAPAPRGGLLARLRTYLLTGVVVSAPISITVYLTLLFINWVDAQVEPLIPAKYNPESYLPFSLPGLGLVVVIVGLTFIGFITANIFGRTLISVGERLVNRMPVVRSIYGALKQILETVLKSSSDSFTKVVLLEYPRRDIWVVGFVSADTEGEVRRRLDEPLINVFVPTTPNPTSGFILFVPKKDCIVLDMSVEEAAKMVISAGVIMPPDRKAPDAQAPARRDGDDDPRERPLERAG